MRILVALLRNQVGASAAEYALILAILGAGIAVAAVALGVSISDSMNVTSNNVENCAGAC